MHAVGSLSHTQHVEEAVDVALLANDFSDHFGQRHAAPVDGAAQKEWRRAVRFDFRQVIGHGLEGGVGFGAIAPVGAAHPATASQETRAPSSAGAG